MHFGCRGRSDSDLAASSRGDRHPIFVAREDACCDVPQVEAAHPIAIDGPAQLKGWLEADSSAGAFKRRADATQKTAPTQGFPHFRELRRIFYPTHNRTPE